MDICGIQMQAQAKPSKQPFSLERTHGVGTASFICLGLLLLGVVLSGCMSMQFGSPPQTDALKTLEPGISNKADILMALGEPRGFGQTRFTPGIDPRKIWFYEYVTSDGRNVQVKFLLVFLCNDLYEGYLWFSESQYQFAELK